MAEQTENTEPNDGTHIIEFEVSPLDPDWVEQQYREHKGHASYLYPNA